MKTEGLTADDFEQNVKGNQSGKVIQNKAQQLQEELNELLEKKRILEESLAKKQNKYTLALNKILKHFKKAKYLSIYRKDNFIFVYRDGNLVWEFKKEELNSRSKPIYRREENEESDEENESMDLANSSNSQGISEEKTADEPTEVKQEVR